MHRNLTACQISFSHSKTNQVAYCKCLYPKQKRRILICIFPHDQCNPSVYTSLIGNFKKLVQQSKNVPLYLKLHIATLLDIENLSFGRIGRQCAADVFDPLPHIHWTPSLSTFPKHGLVSPLPWGGDSKMHGQSQEGRTMRR